MSRLTSILLLLSLAACTTAAPQQFADSPCLAGEATHACQVKRYHDVATP